MKKHNIKQKSKEWHHLRKGKITGTALKGIMGTPKAAENTMYELIAQRLTLGIPEKEDPRERGNRLESEAIGLFELETGKKVLQTGFQEDEDNPTIANSPDGSVEGCETEDVEAKCPEGKNYVKAWLKNEVPEEYEWQVVQYFIVNKKLKILWFVLYNPDIPIHPLHIIKVTRKEIEASIKLAEKKQQEMIEKVEGILSNIIKL